MSISRHLVAGLTVAAASLTDYRDERSSGRKAMEVEGTAAFFRVIASPALSFDRAARKILDGLCLTGGRIDSSPSWNLPSIDIKDGPTDQMVWA